MSKTKFFWVFTAAIVICGYLLHQKVSSYIPIREGHVVQCGNMNGAALDILFVDNKVFHVSSVVGVENVPILRNLFSKAIYRDVKKCSYVYIYQKSDGRFVLSTTQLNQDLLDEIFIWPVLMSLAFIYAIFLIIYLRVTR